MDTTILWSGIIGQTDAIAKICASLDAGEHHHAWLFVGPRGVGKWTTAKVMAAALNCEEQGCGRCVPCDKVMREIHPDVILVEPEGNFITIDQVRELQQSVSLKNFEGKNKVIVIDEADTFTAEAANALLKTLEEPPPAVVFILVTANIDAMLPTIISRCRQVQFSPIPTSETAAFLMERYGTAYDQAMLAAKLSLGVLGSAIALATSISKQERRKRVLGVARDIDRVDVARLSFVAEELLAEIKKGVGEVKERQKKELAWLKEQSGQKDIPAHIRKHLEQKHKREASREEHQGFEELLTILVSWFRDIILFKETGRDDLLANQDKILEIKEHVDLVTGTDIHRCLQIIEETKQLARFNVNMQLALENMLFKIHEVVAVDDASYLY